MLHIDEGPKLGGRQPLWFQLKGGNVLGANPNIAYVVIYGVNLNHQSMEGLFTLYHNLDTGYKLITMIYFVSLNCMLSL